MGSEQGRGFSLWISGVLRNGSYHVLRVKTKTEHGKEKRHAFFLPLSMQGAWFSCIAFRNVLHTRSPDTAEAVFECGHLATI